MTPSPPIDLEPTSVCIAVAISANPYRQSHVMRFPPKISGILISLVTGLSLTAIGRSEDALTRAGCPHQVAWYARPGYGNKYIVYYVGGGAGTCRGEPRYCNEGTFGVDYMPIVPGFHEAVALKWWHGRRNQGGPGQYEPNFLVRGFPNTIFGSSDLR